jgi:hypothetical protein
MSQTDPNGNDTASGAAKKRNRPNKPLPTDRIAFSKQLDILRAFAAAHTSSGKAVSYKEVAGIVNMSDTTVPLGVPFWVDVGLLERAEGAALVPATAVMNFSRQYEWNAETAPHKLGSQLRESWFSKVVLPRLAFRAMDEKEVLEILADQASASPEYRGQVRLLIDYMVSAGMVERDGAQIRLVRNASAPEEERPEKREVLTGKQPDLAKILGGEPPAPAGDINLRFAITVSMAQLGTWSPERISAFFSGLAQVLAARGKED